MTKKDFQLIAETIANMPTFAAGTRLGAVQREDLIAEFAAMCASTNPRFDRGRFVTACETPNYRAPRNVTRYAI